MWGLGVQCWCGEQRWNMKHHSHKSWSKTSPPRGRHSDESLKAHAAMRSIQLVQIRTSARQSLSGLGYTVWGCRSLKTELCFLDPPYGKFISKPQLAAIQAQTIFFLSDLIKIYKASLKCYCKGSEAKPSKLGCLDLLTSMFRLYVFEVSRKVSCLWCLKKVMPQE